jgi:hypothetical protein
MQKPRKLPRDLNSRAAQIVALSTGQPVPNLSGKPVEPVKVAAPAKEKNPAAVSLGRLGGLKGGKARAERLTPDERKSIAAKGASARWRLKP